MKTLVTGGTGYLGTHVRQFFDADDFSRESGFDVLNPSDTKIAANYDLIIHMAALLDKSPESSEEVFLTNVEGTLNLLKSVNENAVFVFVSTKDVYGRFADKYGVVPEDCPTSYSGQSALEWSKLIAERYVEFYGNQRNFRTCIFRLSTVYAPPTKGTMPNFVGHYVDAINTGESVRLPGGGTPVRDFLDVRDFASACQAFERSIIRHGLYNLGGGPKNRLSILELFRKLEEVSGYQGVIDESNPLPPPVPLNYVSDISLITRELDWTPRISLDAGLANLFQPETWE